MRGPVGSGSVIDTYQYLQEATAKGAGTKKLPDIPQSVYDMIPDQTDDRNERAELRQRLDIIQGWIDTINALPPEKRAEIMQKLFGELIPGIDYDSEHISAAGMTLAAVLSGDEDELEDMIIDICGFADDALENGELGALTGVLNAALQELGVDTVGMQAASGDVETGVWRDTLAIFSRTEFLEAPEKKGKGVWFEGSEEARALFASKGQEGSDMYRKIEQAIQLANSTLGMCTPEQAAQFISEFFGKASGDWDDEDDKGTMGRLVAAVMSGDIGAIEDAIDECDLEEVEGAFETFSTKVSEFKTNNEIRPDKEKAAKEFWQWLNGQPSSYVPPEDIQREVDDRKAMNARG